MSSFLSGRSSLRSLQFSRVLTSSATITSVSVFAAIAGFALGCGSSSDTPSPIAASDTGGDTSTTDALRTDSGGCPAYDGGVVDSGTCLSTATMEKYFTLSCAPRKCLVGQYAAATSQLDLISWGRHGGPLGFEGTATPTIVRWGVPAASTGDLSPARQAVTVGGVPSGTFWGAMAVDLPFFEWTALSYTGGAAPYAGELVLTTPAGKLTRYNVNGIFAHSGVSVAAGGGGRLLYTGLSPLSTAPTSTSEGGLYAADTCGTGDTAALLPGTDSSCKAPSKIATWETGTVGPVTTDTDQNLFAVLSKIGGSNELRAFEKTTVARGGAATAGTKLESSGEFFNALAADTRTVYYQPGDSKTFAMLDVKALDYSVDSGSKQVTAIGTPYPFLKLTTPGTKVSLTVDDKKRLWVGVTVPGSGETGAASAMFFVFDSP